ISGLGRLGPTADSWKVPPTTGAITAFAAPAGRLAATGWQSTDQALQLTATTLLVRGAIVRVSERVDNFAHQQNLPHGVLAMGQAISTTASIETRLHASITVVAIVLDALTARLPGDDDVEIAATNASIAPMPIRAGGGQRAVMLFDVSANEAPRQ